MTLDVKIGSDKNSPAINHPDFEDVYKTTFGKGVITDVKKVNSDPIAPESLFKVKVNGSDSDWIPVFFHPKKQYWDDGQHKAEDYSQGSQYYERAWMSFRAGDEVAVMLKEDVAVAVLGFADGIPKVGENIVKLSISTITKYLDCLQQKKYDDEEDGPDGCDLKLSHNCEMVFEKKTTEPLVVGQQGYNTPIYQIEYGEHHMSNWRYDPTPSQYPPGYNEGTPPGDFWTFSCGVEGCQMLYDAVNVDHYLLKTYIIRQYLAIVGPILYCFQFYGYEMDTRKPYTQKITTVGGTEWWSLGIFNHIVCPGHWWWPAPIWEPFHDNMVDQGQPVLDYANGPYTQNYNANPIYTDNRAYWNYQNGIRKFTILAMRVSAGIYTEQLYNSIKGQPSAPEDPLHVDSNGKCTENNYFKDYHGMTEQVAMRHIPNQYIYFLLPGPYDADNAPLKITTTKLAVRPHTKQEGL